MENIEKIETLNDYAAYTVNTQGQVQNYPELKGQTIRIKMGKHEIGIKLFVQHDGCLTIRGDGLFQIAPSAANCIHIKVVDNF